MRKGLPSIYSFTTPVDAEVTIETITPSHFDRSVVAPLLAVASKERPADSLIQPPESKPALALDPATIKQTMAVDSRGVQAILKWISEGGGNAEFVKLINRIIVEDGGVGPLVQSGQGGRSIGLHGRSGSWNKCGGCYSRDDGGVHPVRVGPWR